MNDQEKQETEAPPFKLTPPPPGMEWRWRQEYTPEPEINIENPPQPMKPHPKNPRSQKSTTPRPRDRVTDNRDLFRRKLARLHDLGRVTPSHVTEPDTDARIIA